MRWTALLFLVAGCSFDSSGVAFASDSDVPDGYSSRDAHSFDTVTPIVDARAIDAAIDASPSDAALPDADQHPSCTLDIECKSQFGPFHCCYVGLPPVPPGICVEGNIVGGAGCVAADGELPDAGS